MRRFMSGPGARPFGWALRLIIGACLLGLVLPAAALFLPTAPAAFANPTTISGSVYRDYDDSGDRQAREIGVPGILVSAYVSATQVYQVRTANDGTYTLSLPVPAGTKVRVEFDVPAGGFQSSAFGSTSGTTAQFVATPDTDVNLGILRPSQYCQAAAELNLATSCFVNGNQIATDAGQPRTEPVVVDLPYQAGRAPRFAGPDDPAAHSLMIPANTIGTVWGLAYQRYTNTMFAGAFLKRHSGFGPGGPGAIYRFNPSTPSGNAQVFLDLNALFGPGTAGADPRTNTTNLGYIVDTEAFPLVGKVGLGDVEMGEDDQTLYVIALGDRRLYEIPVGDGPTAPAAAAIKRFSLPEPTGADACVRDPNTPVGEVNLNLRPFGLGVNDGLVYVGAVCTGENTPSGVQNPADVRAYVFAYNPATAQFQPNPVLTMPLDYTRGCLERAPINCASTPARWRPWIRTFAESGQLVTPFAPNSFVRFAPQPWLVGIEFDNGTMVLGFRDRFGDQAGNQAAAPGDNDGPPPFYIGLAGGDTLRACPAAGGTFALEGSAGCARTNAGNANGQGPNGGEFYFTDDHFFHDEVSGGGLLQVDGYGELAVTVNDPIEDRNSTFDGGLRWFNGTTGSTDWRYRLFNSSASIPPPAQFGKTNGLGDLEALCNAAPVEIGNRVWYDINKDGVQDADEAPVPGVTLRLYDDQGRVVATAITNANGEYYFRGGPPTGDATPNDFIGQIAGPMPFNTKYQIRIDNPADMAAGGPLYQWYLTRWDQGDSRVRDSNGRWVSTTPNTTQGYVIGDVVTGRAGQNDHTYDFGFIQDTTRVQLQSFVAERTDVGVEVRWDTAAEVDTWGFNVYRSADGNRANAVKVTPELITAQGRGRGGASYLWLDTTAEPGVSYRYWLQEVELNGATVEYGPAAATQVTSTRHRFYMPFVRH